ncbi:glycosyltransferase family 2 protein [Gymnodinialimonas ulvae]|uniref:glycosyltransferase family 2 protein n=1 Tax=Gymnodinialimonas ulvae TaxID=3126504 RepID=UPI0030EB265D
MRSDVVSVLARAGMQARALAHLPADAEPDRPVTETPRLVALLQVRGLVTPAEIAAAERAQRGTTLALGQVLLTQGAISEAELLSALTHLYGVGLADFDATAPDASLAAALPVPQAIANEAVIWQRSGSALVIATSRPDRLDAIRSALPPDTRVLLAIAGRAQIIEAQRRVYGPRLAREAEGRAPAQHSCRTWRGDVLGRATLVFAVTSLIGLWLAPQVLTVAIFGLVIAVFAANSGLKLASLIASVRAAGQANDTAAQDNRFLHKPTVSIIVPLFREPEVAGALVDRLRALDYPLERLDVLLAIEEDDPLTISALRMGALPPWMRAVIVPRGHPQTKPRALNYVLNYARGDIVGIYDAEDRPEPDQLNRVVQRFAEVPGDVACLQGRLDYYNARHNWLSRMFTVEYAAWFRVLLPGVQRLGLVVPLGGTTLFLRRNVLEEVGAWDAHNVTEDAELGLRLARAGYATEIVDTTTFEEANAAVGPWILQRSRWLKGYLMTWGSAMRNPRALRRDLGWKRYLGLQVQFLGAVLGFLMAPLLWSFAIKAFGLWHPLDAVLSPTAYLILCASMLAGLLLSVGVSLYACRAKHLRHLRPITALVEPYYLFGTVAAWIGLAEVIARPFFWAKTTHGAFGGSEAIGEDQIGTADRQLHAAQ